MYKLKKLVAIQIIITMLLAILTPVVNANENEIPKAFNLKEKINISVENQGAIGSSWSFAALNTLETYLSLNENKEFDFSEMHLECIENGFEEASKLYEGGFNTEEFKDGTDYDRFVDYFANLKGPVFESKIPYYKNNNKDSKYTDADKELFENNNISVFVFEVAHYSIDDYKSENKENEFLNDVKNHIMKNGALSASINASSILPLENGGKGLYYVPKENEYMQNPNHAVTIIGWDDEYSKDNFNKEARPEKDGAYIALNSWGEDWGENGIFYISYEDYWVNQNMNGIQNASTKFDKNVIKDVQIEDKEIYNKIKNVMESIGDITNNSYASRGFSQKNTYMSCDDKKQILKLLPVQIQNIQYLNLSNMNITSTKGLSGFTNCKEYNFSNCNLNSLDVLDNLSDNIKALKLSKNNLEDISKIAKFKNLVELNLSDNKIKDITVLKELKKLDELNLYNQTIEESATLKESKYTLPTLISDAVLYNEKTPIEYKDGKEKRAPLLELNKIKTQNVEVSDDYSEISFNNKKGTVTITLKGGVVAGTVYKLSYEIKDEDDTKQEDTKQEDTKQDNTKQEDTKQEDTKQEDTKQDEPKQDEPKQDEPKQDDTKKDDTKQDNTKQDNIETISSQSQDVIDKFMKKSEEAEKKLVIVNQSKVSKANNGENQPGVTVKGDEYIYDSKAEPEPEPTPTPQTPNTPKEETPKKNPTVNYVTPEPETETPSKIVNPIIQSVKTGDNIIIFIIMGIIAVVGIVVIIVLKKKNKKEE